MKIKFPKSAPLHIAIITAIVLMLLIVVLPTTTMLYLNFSKNLKNNIDGYFTQTENIVKMLLEQKIQLLDMKVLQFIGSKSIRDAQSVKAFDIKNELKQPLYDDIDIVFFKKGNSFKDYSASIYDTQKILEIVKYRSDMDHSEIVSIKTDDKRYLFILRSKEIIDPVFGRVIGRIYLGSFLNDNFSFLEEIKQRTGLKEAILSSKGDIVASTVEGELFEEDLLKTHKDIHKDISLTAFAKNSSLEELKSDFLINMILVVIILAVLLIISISYFKHTITKPLEKLVQYARGASFDQEVKIQRFRVKEFNILAIRLKLILSNLIDTKNRFQLAIEGANDGLFDLNVKTGKVYWSPRWKQMIGYADDELPNDMKEWEKRVHKDDLDNVYLNIEKYFNRQKPLFEAVHRLRHKNGSWVWILARGKALFDKEGKPVRLVGFHTDITDQKEHEKNLEELIDEKVTEIRKKDDLLVEKSKMAAMGEMIGAIAHQWRQPLSSLSINIQNPEDDYDDGFIDEKFLTEFIQNQMDTIKYLSHTIDDFRNFYSPDKDKTIFDAQKAIDDASKILTPQLQNYNIGISKDSADSFKVLSYEGEFKQVVLNIISNMKDAIIQKDIKEGKIKISISVKDDYGYIYIKDNAGGIPSEIIDKIFEPHFTTKEKDKGTGLGLYMSKVIIEQNMNGVLRAANDEDGALFTIKLKVYDG